MFSLAIDNTRRNIAHSLRAQRITERVKIAYQDQEAKKRFTADHAEKYGTELDALWRTQVVEETTRLLLVEIIKTVDQEVVEALRQQALERTAGMDETVRKELVRAVTQPIHKAFIDLVAPTIRHELSGILDN